MKNLGDALLEAFAALQNGMTRVELVANDGTGTEFDITVYWVGKIMRADMKEHKA